MKKRILGILLALVMVVSLMPERVMAAEQPVLYITWNGDGTPKDNECSSYTTVSTESTTWSSGWYVVSGTVEITERITVSSSIENGVHLILCDGATLTASKGINVSGTNSLTIYGQTKGTGKLVATSSKECAGIGGNKDEIGGTITINGGTITAKGGMNGGAGIGGGSSGAGGYITINGGMVEATGGANGGAGIGGGAVGAGGSITINGGMVTAIAESGGAGIGGGTHGDGGAISINGGTVTANGSGRGAGIGGGDSGAGGNITINGGTVTAKGGGSGDNAGIGGGGNGDVSGGKSACGHIVINGGEITAIGKAVGIGGSVIDGNDVVVVKNELTIRAGASAENASVVSSTDFDETNSYQYARIDESHTHDDITFLPWSKTTELPTEAGNYYLEADVTLSGSWTVPTETTNLCLNGHVITGNGSSNYINVASGSILNVYDCNTTTVYKFSDTEGYWKLNASGNQQVTGGIITADGAKVNCVVITGGEFTLNGGSICGSNGKAAVFVSGGQFTINGGNICGNKGDGREYGGGVRVDKGTCFTMNGGSIHHNQAGMGGGVYVQNGTFNMTGGEIIDNIATQYGGGVLACKNASNVTVKVAVGGDAIVKNNKVTATSGTVEQSNIHLKDNDKNILSVLSSPSLMDGAAIGVTLYIDDESGWKPGTEVGSYFGDTLTSANYKYFTINNAGKADTGTVYRVAQIGTSPDFYYVRGGNFSVTGYTDPATPSLGRVASDKDTCNDGATVTLTVSPTEGYMLAANSLKASYVDPIDGTKTFDCTLTQDATDSSKYTFMMPAANVTVTADFEQIVANVTTDPAAVTGLVYNGAAQALVTEGAAANGTMQYALGTSAEGAPEGGWSTELPKETAAGTYYVWYKAVGSDGALDSAAACVTVTIAQKDIAGATVGAFEQMTYNGEAQMPNATVIIDGLTATGSWSSVTNVADTTTFTANGNFTGSIANKATGIAKRTPAAPTKLNSVKPSEIGKSDGKITGTTTAMEYGTDVDFSDAKPCTGDEITGLAAGTYYVRIKETANESASNYVSITVSDGDKKNFTTVVIDNYSGVYDGAAHGITVSGVPDGATVMYGTTSGTYDMDSISYTEFTNGAKTIFVKVSAENYNNWFGSGTVTITKRVPAAPTGLGSVKPSEFGKSDGQITGTTTAMEYSTDVTFDDAIVCTGTEITGLTAGTYYVRIKETANETASNYVSVIVPDGDKKNPTPEPDPIIIIPPQTTPAPTQDEPTVPETPAESYTVPVKGDDTVKVEAELKDGNADVKEITSKELEKIFSEASEEEAKPVTVDLSDTKQEINSVTFTKKSVENIAKVVADESNPADSFEVKYTNADLILDDKAVAAVNEQAKGDDISLIVDEGKDIELNNAQQKAIKNDNVVTIVDARILSNGKEIHKLNGGSALIKIKPDGEKILKNRKYTVKYVSEDGTVEVIETTTDGSHIIFKISHFSDYVIVYDEDTENDTENDTEVKTVKAPYIKLSKTIGLGNTFNMAVTNVSDDADVKYSSSDKSVATVDNNGVITAVGLGKCTVKGVIKQHGITYKFALAVTVKDTGKGNRQIKEDECLTPNSLTPLFNVYKVVNTARPLALNIKRLAADAIVTYSSEDESIAVVSKDGIITGLKKGYVGINVYVKQNGQTLQYRVFVRVSDK